MRYRNYLFPILFFVFSDSFEIWIENKILGAGVNSQFHESGDVAVGKNLGLFLFLGIEDLLGQVDVVYFAVCRRHN